METNLHNWHQFVDKISLFLLREEAESPPPPPSQADLDPRLFAPTGDVYSYFQRRKVDPFFFTNPLPVSTRNSLGGKYSKTIVF